MRTLVRTLLLFLAMFGTAVSAAAETYSWVDENGITHLSDSPEAAPPSAQPEAGRQALKGLWDDDLGPISGQRSRTRSLDGEPARQERVLRGAVEDLERGEAARATAALMSILRGDPNHPESHWYLALMNRQRGRYETAKVHLEAFLAVAGDEFEPWRASARRRLRQLVDERRLAEAATTDGTWLGLSTAHFRVHYDPALGRASPDYAQRVVRYLEEARVAVGERLGALPQEAMGVVFYGKATYLEAHSHRFSFQTVGFFDGRIHVVSAGHPAGELRGLLFHEYAHAVYREQTGGDRPYWLNEGLAELSERASQNRRGLTRSERQALRRRIDADEWIPLRRIAPSFSGLENDDARAAYLESMAAATWIEARTTREQRARLLRQLGGGVTDDEALLEVLGLDTEAIDTGLRREIRDEFPTLDSSLHNPNEAPASGAPANGAVLKN